MSVPLGTGGDYHLWIRTERNPDLLSPAVSGESFRARAHAGRAAYPVCVRRKRNCFRSRGRTVPSLPCRGSRRIPKRAKLPHSVQDRQTTAVLRKTAHIPARSDARGGRQARCIRQTVPQEQDRPKTQAHSRYLIREDHTPPGYHPRAVWQTTEQLIILRLEEPPPTACKAPPVGGRRARRRTGSETVRRARSVSDCLPFRWAKGSLSGVRVLFPRC